MGSIYVICSRQCPNGDGIYTLLYALYKYSTSITNQPTKSHRVRDTNHVPHVLSHESRLMAAYGLHTQHTAQIKTKGFKRSPLLPLKHPMRLKRLLMGPLTPGPTDSGVFQGGIVNTPVADHFFSFRSIFGNNGHRVKECTPNETLWDCASLILWTLCCTSNSSSCNNRNMFATWRPSTDHRCRTASGWGPMADHGRLLGTYQ